MSWCLGIESSCDDTAVAIVADGRRVVAEAIASQADDFAAWGGVVPELAARGHLAVLPGLFERVLKEANLQLSDLDVIAVGAWPGLIGSLLSGVTAAKMLAARSGAALVAVDHIHAHLAAVELGDTPVTYPFIGLVASGGHSHLYRCDAPGIAELLGGTIDDAAGEAFDKVAAILGLPYPGGPAIDHAAMQGDPKRFPLPRSFIHDATLRYSFAGVKTALLYQVRGPKGLDPLTLDQQGIADACASFQTAVVDALVNKLVLAAEQLDIPRIALGGGVACNRGLRQRVSAEAKRRGWQAFLPEPRHCTDNGAMIAVLGHHRWQAGHVDDLSMRPLPTGTAGPRASA
jgi:N6-L-threonylcarbamoyladenine synthase